MAFHSYTQLIRKLFNAYRCGPPSRVTGTSPWPSVDHLVSRLPPPTKNARCALCPIRDKRPLQARFHCGAGAKAPQPCRRRQLVGSLCKRHAVTAKRQLRPLAGAGFQDLFHPSRRSAFHLSFTVLVHYRSHGSIQPCRMVPADSRRIPRVPRYSGCRYAGASFGYGAITPCGAAFQPLPLAIAVQHRGPTTPGVRRHTPGLGSSPVARRYWGNHWIIFFSSGY